jgi:LacI family transcriptional regulator
MGIPRVTQSDVARHAGVSRRLVSAVLHNNAPHIVASPETRERVRRAADELGYRPNVVARSLATGRTYTLGLVIHSLTNPFFAALAESLYAAARGRGYDLLVALSEGKPDRVAHQIDYLIQRQVDGLLVWRGQALTDYPALAAPRKGMPYVALGRYIPEPGPCCIGVDRGAGMEQAVDHLVRLGMTRIGYVGLDVVARLPQDSSTKCAGFLTALGRRGLEPVLCARPRYEQFMPDGARQGGYELGREIAAAAMRPRAMLCEGDLLALGLIRGLRDGGARVPQEVAVIGFDGIAEGQFSEPRLTTIAQPRDSLVELGLNALFRQIENPEAPPERVMLEPRLIVRESCGAVCPPDHQP